MHLWVGAGACGPSEIFVVALPRTVPQPESLSVAMADLLLTPLQDLCLILMRLANHDDYPLPPNPVALP